MYICENSTSLSLKQRSETQSENSTSLDLKQRSETQSENSTTLSLKQRSETLSETNTSLSLKKRSETKVRLVLVSYAIYAIAVSTCPTSFDTPHNPRNH